MRLCWGGLNLYNCLVRDDLIVREIGAKRTKLYTFRICPCFNAGPGQWGGLKGDYKVVDERTIEVQAVNSADPSDTSACRIYHGEDMYVHTFREPEAFDVGDWIAVHALKVSCYCSEAAGGHCYSAKCMQVNKDVTHTDQYTPRSLFRVTSSVVPSAAA